MLNRELPIITGQNAENFLRNEKENKEKLYQKAEQIKNDINVKTVLNEYNFTDEQILNIYLYGSRVYGCNSETSDYDYTVIIKGENYWNQIIHDDINITFYSPDIFQRMIDEHNCSALECLWLKEEYIIKEEIKFKFDLDLHTLREAFSKKASNSYVKCKKKLIVEEDFNPYIGKKSLFHALRIIIFGIQIAKNDKIIDYGEANPYLKEILDNPSEKWEDYQIKYQPIYNNLKSIFRELVPLK